MAEYQRQINIPVRFVCTATNATRYQWKLDSVIISSETEFTRTFTTIGFHTVEVIVYNDCNDECIRTARIEIVSSIPSKPDILDIKIGDYTTETSIVQTPIHRRGSTPKVEKVSEELNTILRRIELLETDMVQMHKMRVNYNTHYFIDTSSASRRKIDLIKDIGVAAVELYVISEGGGFTMEVNDEGYAMTVRTGFKIMDEKIERIYVTGSGTTGTGRIRIGTWR